MKTPVLLVVAVFAFAIAGHNTDQAADPLPSWSEGSAKQAIVDFVRATTEQGSPKFVPQEERIARFMRFFGSYRECVIQGSSL